MSEVIEAWNRVYAQGKWAYDNKLGCQPPARFQFNSAHYNAWVSGYYYWHKTGGK